MALTEEDLRFLMTVDPDIDAVRKALGDITRQLSQVSSTASANVTKALVDTSKGSSSGMISAMSEAGRLQAKMSAEDERRKAQWSALGDMGRKQLDEIHGILAVEEGLRSVEDIRKSMAEEGVRNLNSMREQLIKIQYLEDPSVLRYRLEYEKQIKDSLHEQEMTKLRESMMPDRRADELEKEREITALQYVRQVQSLKESMDPGRRGEALRREQEITDLRHEQQMLSIKEASSADAVTKRVSLELKEVEARKSLAQLESGERTRQWAQMLGGAVRGGYERAGIGGAASVVLGQVAGDIQSRGADVGGDIGAKFGGRGRNVGRVLGDVAEKGLKGEEMFGEAGGMIGETLGAAVGGPAGAMVGKVLGEQLAKAIPDMIAAPAKLLTGSLKTVSESLQGLQGPLGPIGVGFDLVGKAMSFVGDKIKAIPIVGQLLGPMIDALTAIPGIIKDILETLTSFAGKFNPASVELLGMAVEDVQATIGQAFIPVVELMRDTIRGVGDVIAQIIPNTQEVAEALEPLRDAFSELGEVIREIATEFGPIIRDVIRANMIILAEVLSVVARSITVLVSAFARLYAPIKDLLNLVGIGTDKNPRHYQAARQASIGSIEDYGRQLQQAAYSMPGTPTTEDVPSLVSGISGTLSNIWNFMSTSFTAANFISWIITGIRDAALKPIGDAPDAVRNLLGGMSDSRRLDALRDEMLRRHPEYRTGAGGRPIP